MLAIDIGFVAGLMLLGAWLERTGGMDGWADKFFTPIPLGFSGAVFVVFEGFPV